MSLSYGDQRNSNDLRVTHDQWSMNQILQMGEKSNIPNVGAKSDWKRMTIITDMAADARHFLNRHNFFVDLHVVGAFQSLPTYVNIKPP